MSPFAATTAKLNGGGPKTFTLAQLPPFDSVGAGSIFEIFARAHRCLFGTAAATPAGSRGAEGALFAPLLPPTNRNQAPPLVVGVLRRVGPECIFADDAAAIG